MPFEPLDQYLQRQKKLAEIEARGHDAYPHRFDWTATPAEVVEKYTPADAAAMHRMIRDWLGRRSGGAFRFPILYGGSVSPDNVAALLAEPDLDGVLVGGASLTADAWLLIVDAR